MTTSERDHARPALALILGLALALAPALAGGLAPAVLAQGQAPEDDARGGANDSPDQRNESGSQQRGDGASEAQRGPENRGPPEDRGRAPPVDVEDRRGGFATRAPPDSPRPEVAVDARNATATVQRADVRAMDVHLDQVVAFTDADDDGAYDVGEPVLERQTLPDRPNRIVADEANATRILVYELDEAGEAELHLVFDLGTDHAERVATKFDVELRNYTFEAENAHVALGSRVQVAGGLERVERNGHPAVAGEQGEEVTYLSWVPNATVDGTEHPVGSSVHVDAEQPADSAIVYWAYPQGDRIVHDPALGVGDAIRDFAGSLPSFGLGLAATTTILFAGYAIRARWPT